MAKNISLMGASYSDVPAVVLPQTGGGTARFDDASVTTATASDVAQGKVFLASDGTITTGTASGGGGEPVTEKQINFIDYDGTILHSYTASEWASVTALPSNPSHTGLTAQGWNWTKAEIDAQLTAVPDGDIFVGQMYVTDDGKTRLYCRFEEGRLHPYLGIGLNGTVVIDWGDGSATSTLTGTSLTDAQVADHVYASGGDYMITLTVSSGSAQIYGNSSTTFLLRQSGSTSRYNSRVYSNSLVKVQLGTDIGIGTSSFYNCYSLASITIPSGVTSISTDAFNNCYSLASITIPSGVTIINTSSFNSCYSLASIMIPSGLTSISAYAFNNCYALASITIPSGVTSIGTFAFYACYSLASITIPSGVTIIDTSSFSNCYSLASITIPSGVTIINTYAFYNCYALASITIPSGLTSISANAFYNCYALASITIPSGVTSIGAYSFYSCYSLASITIPSGVTSISAYAFNNDYGLGEIHFKPTTPPKCANSNAWKNLQTDCIIYVPTGSLSAYTSAANYPSSSTYTYVEE